MRTSTSYSKLYSCFFVCSVLSSLEESSNSRCYLSFKLQTTIVRGRVARCVMGGRVDVVGTCYWPSPHAHSHTRTQSNRRSHSAGAAAGKTNSPHVAHRPATVPERAGVRRKCARAALAGGCRKCPKCDSSWKDSRELFRGTWNAFARACSRPSVSDASRTAVCLMLRRNSCARVDDCCHLKGKKQKRVFAHF